MFISTITVQTQQHGVIPKTFNQAIKYFGTPLSHGKELNSAYKTIIRFQLLIVNFNSGENVEQFKFLLTRHGIF